MQQTIKTIKKPWWLLMVVALAYFTWIPLTSADPKPDKRILFIGLSGHGKTTSINTFASVLLGGQRCQFIIPTVNVDGSRYPIEGDNGLRTEGITKEIYADNILPFPETHDSMMSDTNSITGYMVQRIGQNYELIDTPGLNDNRGKLTDKGQGEANNRTLLEALRAEIIRGEQTGQMIDAVVFVLSPTGVRVNCSTGCSNYSLLSLGIKDLIDSFPEEVVNTNFFFLANKCDLEEEVLKLYDDIKVALPQVRYERLKQVNLYSAIRMHESEIWNDNDRAQMTPDQLCQEKLNRLRYQKACAVFQALDNEIASLQTSLQTLKYQEYMHIYQQLANLVGQRLEADRKHKQLEKTHEKQQFDSFLDECKRDYHQAQIVKSKEQAGVVIHIPVLHDIKGLENYAVNLIHDGQYCAGGNISLEKVDDDLYSGEACGTVGRRLLLTCSTIGGKSQVSKIKCQACNWSKTVTWSDKYYQQSSGEFSSWFLDTSPVIYADALLRDHGCLLSQEFTKYTPQQEVTYQQEQLNPTLVSYEDEDSKKNEQFFRQSAQQKQDKCNQLQAQITTHQENIETNYPKQARDLVKALSDHPQYFQTGDRQKIIDQVMAIAKVNYKEYDQDVIQKTIGELIGVAF